MLRKLLVVVLELHSLALRRVEPQVQPAGNERHEDDIAQVYLGDPTHLEMRGTREARRKEEPAHDREGRIEQIVGAEETLGSEEVFEDHERLPWPPEQGAGFRQLRGLPFAARIPGLPNRLPPCRHSSPEPV